jgi:hypothetical protein
MSTSFNDIHHFHSAMNRAPNILLVESHFHIQKYMRFTTLFNHNGFLEATALLDSGQSNAFQLIQHVL